LNGDPPLLAAMPFLHRDVPTGIDVGKIVLDLCVDVIHGGLIQIALVPFERQHIVALPSDDLFRNRRLRPRGSRTTNGVDGDEGAPQINEL